MVHNQIFNIVDGRQLKVIALRNFTDVALKIDLLIFGTHHIENAFVESTFHQQNINRCDISNRIEMFCFVLSKGL